MKAEAIPLTLAKADKRFEYARVARYLYDSLAALLKALGRHIRSVHGQFARQ